MLCGSMNDLLSATKQCALGKPSSEPIGLIKRVALSLTIHKLLLLVIYASNPFRGSVSTLSLASIQSLQEKCMLVIN